MFNSALYDTVLLPSDPVTLRPRATFVEEAAEAAEAEAEELDDEPEEEELDEALLPVPSEDAPRPPGPDLVRVRRGADMSSGRGKKSHANFLQELARRHSRNPERTNGR